MTKLSRALLEGKYIDKFLNNFWSLITLLENKDQAASFLKDLLTHTEMKMFAKRVQIAKMLLEGYSYNEIRNVVKVTDPTISKMSNLLAVGGEGIRNAIANLQKIEEDIEEERLGPFSKIEKKYGMYFLPEKLAKEAVGTIKKRSKKYSARKHSKL